MREAAAVPGELKVLFDRVLGGDLGGGDVEAGGLAEEHLSTFSFATFRSEVLPSRTTLNPLIGKSAHYAPLDGDWMGNF